MALKPAPHSWLLRGQSDEIVKVPVNPPHTISHGEALPRAALAGAGLAYPPSCLAIADLREGRLEVVLTTPSVEERPVHLLWPPLATRQRRGPEGARRG